MIDPSTPAPNPLSIACEAWQGGRDSGSSPIRAAARVLTEVTHYFSAPFIDQYEADARADPTTLGYARTLLEALDHSKLADASQWGLGVGLASGWAGRGIKSGPQDDQIREAIVSGRLLMPLWGVSVDRTVAESFGTGFIFELQGTFPAVPASAHSGVKADEYELIVGGHYAVTDVDDSVPNSTRVTLRFEGTLSI